MTGSSRALYVLRLLILSRGRAIAVRTSWPLLQIRVDDILQYSQFLLLRLHSGPLEPPCLPFGTSCHPPGCKRNEDATSNNAHTHSKRNVVFRLIFLSEYLRTNGAANLSVGVDEPDGECRARGPRCSLDSPGPHHWEPCSCTGVCYHDSCIHTTSIWVSIEHSITDQYHTQECQWIYGTRQASGISKVARDTDETDSKE